MDSQGRAPQDAPQVVPVPVVGPLVGQHMAEHGRVPGHLLCHVHRRPEEAKEAGRGQSRHIYRNGHIRGLQPPSGPLQAAGEAEVGPQQRPAQDRSPGDPGPFCQGQGADPVRVPPDSPALVLQPDIAKGVGVQKWFLKVPPHLSRGGLDGEQVDALLPRPTGRSAWQR